MRHLPDVWIGTRVGYPARGLPYVQIRLASARMVKKE
jgi:hypothetical protein